MTTEDMIGIWMNGMKFTTERFETSEAIEIGVRVGEELRANRQKLKDNLIPRVASNHPTVAQSEQRSAGDGTLLRLRTADASLATLITNAVAESPTFKRLVATIEQSDGLVYVSSDKCPEHTRASLLMQVDQAGPNRMLRLRIPAGKADADAIASIGHELQHALEILSDKCVRTTDDLYALYQRIGLDPPASWLQHRTRFHFETAAAKTAGDAIRQEIADSAGGHGVTSATVTVRVEDKAGVQGYCSNLRTRVRQRCSRGAVSASSGSTTIRRRVRRSPRPTRF